MKNKKQHYGFSLVEVLMAVGILAVGLLLVATMFPAAIYMTTVASERTMAAIVADEAFAKIQIYDMNGITSTLNDPCNCYDWGDGMKNEIADSEFEYPAVDPCGGGSSQYYWSALYRKTSNTEDNEYQITVFVARKMNPSLNYKGGKSGAYYPNPWPVPIEIGIAAGSKDSPTMDIGGGDENLVNPSATIVDNETGKLYTVVKRGDDGVDARITLDRNLESDIKAIWLIPPPESGGKNAGVEVYQRIIKF
ncbi:MAG: type IV pilus modification PilV family protein [Sedimentisphaerales bacterium]